MMFAYDFDRLSTSIGQVLKRNLSPQAWQWLDSEGTQVRTTGDVRKFNIAFVAVPRKTGKEMLEISAEDEQSLQAIKKNFTVEGWTRDQLARLWLLLQVPPADKEKYISTIENLFLNGEMSELVALYSALPVLAHPDAWVKRCAEGIRNNIGQVLDAVICRNPYPSEHLGEAAWNQLVLKAIFTEKPVLQIIGLTERRNKALAKSLSDYAHERWAAHRDVNPLLWICVAPFVDTGIFPDIQRLFQNGSVLEREAAALVCFESDNESAKSLLDQYPDMRNAVRSGAISWDDIARRMG